MKRTDTKRLFTRGAGLALATLLVAASGAEAATAQKLCFRDATGVPFTPGPPTIDGNITGDLGWTGAFQYEFGNGSTSPHGVMQGIRTPTNVYLSFQVNNDSSFDDNDVLVLTFDVGGATNRYRRLHVFPLFNGVGAAPDGRAREVQFWQANTTGGDGKVVWGGGTIIPHADLVAGSFWLDAKVTHADAGPGNRSWNVEMRIPVAATAAAPGINFPPGADFKMFLNIFRVDGFVATTPTLQWPTNAPTPADITELDVATPAPTDWGAGTFGTAGCGGVSFAWNDINTNQVPTSKIALNAANFFNVTLHNSSVDNAGNPIPANDIRARFRIANFGIMAFPAWQDVPAADNPTPPGNVPASSTATLSTGAWNLTPAEVTEYTAHQHQCVLVELDSSAPKTQFVTRSTWRNMDFGTASVFKRTAEINTKGFELPKGASAHRFDLVAANTYRVLRRGDNEQKNPKSELTWLFHGYRHTGRYIVIKKKKYELVDAEQSFGYTIQHTLDPSEPIPDPSSTWQTTVKGIELNPDIKEQGKDVRFYRADIKDGDRLEIATVAEYPEKEGSGNPREDAGTPGGKDGGSGGENPPPVDGCPCRRTTPSGTTGLMLLFAVAFFARRGTQRKE